MTQLLAAAMMRVETSEGVVAKDAKLRALILAAGALVAGCDPSSPPDPDLMTLPILEPTGTTTSREFVRLFAEACIPGFPDQQAMAAAFLEEGFAEHAPVRGFDRPGSRHLDRASDELQVSIGLGQGLRPAFPFGDEVIFSFGCSLGGHVSDPANFEAEMLAMLDADGVPLDWRGDKFGYRTVQEREDIAAVLTANPPILLPFRPPLMDPTTICDGLPGCRSWTHAGMAISVRVEPPSR